MWLWHLTTKGQASLAGTYLLKFHLYFSLKHSQFIIEGPWQSQEEIHLEVTEMFPVCLPITHGSGSCFPHPAIGQYRLEEASAEKNTRTSAIILAL